MFFVLLESVRVGMVDHHEAFVGAGLHDTLALQGKSELAARLPMLLLCERIGRRLATSGSGLRHESHGLENLYHLGDLRWWNVR